MQNMTPETSKHIEAILFLAGEPVEISRLEKLFGKSREEINQALIELETALKERGVRLLKNNDEITLGTAPESACFCEELIKEEMNRSIGKAGLETLAVVLYKGAFAENGVSRAEIDYVRGVNSAFTLRNLAIRGLVSRKINPKNKRGFIYTSTLQLLEYLGITKKEDLPDFEEFKKQTENALENINTN